MNCVFLEALNHRRDRDPAHVTYVVVPADFVIDPARNLHEVYDHAYWVSGITVRGTQGTVDAVSLARADRVRAASRYSGTGENVTAGADLCGVNPGAHTNDTWTEQRLTLHPGSAQPVINGLDVTLTGVRTVAFDLPRAGIDLRAPVTVSVTTDGIAELSLSGVLPGTVRSLDGVTQPNGVPLVVPEGSHKIELSSPAIGAAGVEAGDRHSLAATGGYHLPLAVLLLLAAYVAARLVVRPRR